MKGVLDLIYDLVMVIARNGLVERFLCSGRADFDVLHPSSHRIYEDQVS